MNADFKFISRVESYLKTALESFDRDPPSTRYQMGYRNALRELKEVLDEESAKTSDHLH